MGSRPFQLFKAHRLYLTKMNTVKTKSGAQINPFASITDLLSGTSFNSDRETRGHLQSLAAAFHEISQTDHGQMLLSALEGLATKIKTEVSFKDAVKVCFRLAKKISSSPWVQFGMFIALFGPFGAVSLFGLSVSPIARFILNTVL